MGAYKMADDQSNPTGFKISDRRRFDSQGNARPEAEASATPQPTERTINKMESTTNKNTDDPKTKAMRDQLDNLQSELDFTSFIMSLATQALFQLGEMAPPPGVQVNVDRDAAKQTIDVLTLLRQKTKNNLDANESKLLDEILHNLRMGFLKQR